MAAVSRLGNRVGALRSLAAGQMYRDSKPGLRTDAAGKHFLQSQIQEISVPWFSLAPGSADRVLRRLLASQWKIQYGLAASQRKVLCLHDRWLSVVSVFALEWDLPALERETGTSRRQQPCGSDYLGSWTR